MFKHRDGTMECLVCGNTDGPLTWNNGGEING